MAQPQQGYSIGWIGAGRMGFAMAQRVVRAGYDITVYNRTRAKAEPLAGDGAKIARSLADIAACDVVFSMVSTSSDLEQVLLSANGVLASGNVKTKIFVDCSSVSEEASARVRRGLHEVGAQLIAAPISGNPKVVKAGMASIVASGPEDAYGRVRPCLEAIGKDVTYVGDAEHARIVKICHNVFLGVVIQSLSELVVLAEKAGVPRHAFLDFLNKSVMGSVFTRYKTPALVNLDFTTTFTPQLLQKDMDLGLAAARRLSVPMPVASTTRELVQTSIGYGYDNIDFSVLLELQAKASGLSLRPEDVQVDDGLRSPKKAAQAGAG